MGSKKWKRRADGIEKAEKFRKMLVSRISEVTFGTFPVSTGL